MARSSLPRRTLLALAALLSFLVAVPGASAATQARPADAVVESIGVNTHINYSDTQYNNFTLVRQRLNELGIRYVRDHISLRRPDVYSRMRTLASDGIGVNVIAGDPLQRWNIGTLDQQLDLIQAELKGAVVSIEGPNEYDLQGDPNWASVLRDYTKRLWEGVKKRPALAGLPVLGPSIVRRENMPKVGDLTPWIDYGNTHTYLSGAMPETDSVWNGEFAAMRSNSGSKAVQATETGYHNGVNGNVGHQPCSEKATGIYMPRLFLENFRRGVVRSFSYELLDQRNDPDRTDIEANFGLLRNDFSKKPAAVALERLIGLLGDKGASFTPASLDYSVAGAPASAQQLLLQKRDGSFYLVLWNRVSVWNSSNRSDVDPADVPVTINFGQPIESAAVYEPNTAADPIASSANPTSLKVNLSERVSVVKLVPGMSEPEPEPAPVPEPKPEPTPQPDPTPAPTPEPTPSPSPEPAPTPSPEPAPQPTPVPVEQPPVAEQPSSPAPKPAPHTKPRKQKYKKQSRSQRGRGARASVRQASRR